MIYTCPKCNATLDEDSLDSADYGAYEDCMGYRIWKPCLVYTTPCCGVEPDEKEEYEDEKD